MFYGTGYGGNSWVLQQVAIRLSKDATSIREFPAKVGKINEAYIIIKNKTSDI